jgi:hypothetical protein
MKRNNWKTYKINLTDEQEEFLRQKKKIDGTSLGWQLTQAVNEYIQSQSSTLLTGHGYTNTKGNTYYLHVKNVDLKGGRNQDIYYFAVDIKQDSYLPLSLLPSYLQIVESPKTKLPFIKHK